MTDDKIQPPPALPGNAITRFVVAADHPAISGHFPGHPIVPGAVILDHMIAVASAATGASVAEVAQAKFLRPLAPGEVCSIAVDARALPVVRVACNSDAGPVANAVLRMKAAP